MVTLDQLAVLVAAPVLTAERHGLLVIRLTAVFNLAGVHKYSLSCYFQQPLDVTTGYLLNEFSFFVADPLVVVNHAYEPPGT